MHAHNERAMFRMVSRVYDDLCGLARVGRRNPPMHETARFRALVKVSKLLVFLRAGAFAFVLLFVAVVCSRSLPLVFVCFLVLALLRWFHSFVRGQ